jgi:glycosyltransferase involved in cell wall biosynthesis
MSNLKISVVICTHNRGRYLGQAIDSLLQQEFNDFEILVVDNASTDNTKEVVESRLPNSKLRYYYEAELGLNNARNAGVRETKADIIAYLDDDAIAIPQWLSEIYAPFMNNEKLGVVGGKIDLLWSEGSVKPSWLSTGMAMNLGAYDLGDQMIYIDDPGLTPRGLNYAIRRKVYEQVGGFDPKLDRSGKNLLSNGDLYMTELVLKNGWQVAYLPTALVQHQVFPERTKFNWFVNRSWWQGVSEYYRQQVSGTFASKEIFQAGENMLRGVYKSVKNLSNPTESIDNLLYSYGQIGYINAAIKNWWQSKGKQ